MGFGYLFAGYILSINFFAYQGIFFALSFCIMTVGLFRLREYSTGFLRLFKASIPMTVISLVHAVLDILSLCGVNVATPLLYFNTIHPITMLAFTILLLDAIRGIAKETDVPMIQYRAIKQKFLGFVFYIPQILLSFSYDIQSVIFTRILYITTFIFLFFGMIYIGLNAKLIFSCYIWICSEEDVKMERKKSKIPFFDKIDTKLNEKAEQIVERKKAERQEKEEKRKKNERQ